MDFAEQFASPELVDMVTPADRFAEFVRRRSRFIYRIAYVVVRNVQDAEDVVQDLFLKLHRSGAWERMDDEQAFLARAAWRMAIDRLPRCRPMPVPQSTVASHEQAVIDDDLRITMNRLIDALPEDLRQPLVLSAFDEMTSAQIAGMLDIPEGTVRTRIMRARQILKDKLAFRSEISHERK
jgi:RNA polymerase sigma-70 factor (ECF subfamily)